MKQFDLEKLEIAMEYINRIAEGKDPVNNTALEEESVLNNPNLIRCMYFVKEVLAAVKENGGVIVGHTAKATKHPFPFGCLENYTYEADKSISHFLAQLKNLAGDSNVKGIGTKTVTDWLKLMGYMSEEQDRYTGKISSVATAAGIEFGICMEERTSMRGQTYQIVMYSRKAQEFLVRNLEKLVNGEIIQCE